MTQQRHIPELRFPGFEGEWEKTTLDTLLEFKNGINAPKEDYGSGVKFINVLDILNNDFITYDKIIGSVEIDQKTIEKYSVTFGDILFQRSSETRDEVGTANVYLDRENIATFGGFVIRGKKIGEYNPVFLNNLLKSKKARNEITTKSGGSTRYNVGQETLSSVSLNFPSLPEQTHIASFLTAVDQRITLLTQQKEALEQYKKGVMQQLFSQQLRFKDENGNDFPDWEEKKLGNLADIKKGEQLNSSELTISGEYPCQNGGIAPSGFTDKFNTENDTITISEGGNSCGYVNYIKTKFWCGGHCYSILNIKANVYKLFLFQCLKFYETQIMKLRVGSGLPNIQKRDILYLKIKTPTYTEQQKIASFLSSIDAKIEQVSQQIEQSKTWKKGLLQKMFV